MQRMQREGEVHATRRWGACNVKMGFDKSVTIWHAGKKEQAVHKFVTIWHVGKKEWAIQIAAEIPLVTVYVEVLSVGSFLICREVICFGYLSREKEKNEREEKKRVSVVV